jgi:hypothetical protein
VPVLNREGISRREALTRVALGGAALLTGCAPARLLLKTFPDLDAGNSAEPVLRAFVDTVIPGAAADPRPWQGIYRDPFYQFDGLAGWFVDDLNRRARKHRRTGFERLDPDDRTRVIQAALAGDFITRKIYTGAVFLAQITICGAIDDRDPAAPAIGFEGRYQFQGYEAISHPAAERFLPATATRDGNHV